MRSTRTINIFICCGLRKAEIRYSCLPISKATFSKIVSIDIFVPESVTPLFVSILTLGNPLSCFILYSLFVLPHLIFWLHEQPLDHLLYTIISFRKKFVRICLYHCICDFSIFIKYITRLLSLLLKHPDILYIDFD